MDDAFSREGFELDPIEGLRKSLPPKFVETIVEREEVDDSNEESFKCLKESIEEYYKFCEQLIELCPDKDFLVKFCERREEEYDAILQNYEENPTLNAAWEVAIAYYGVN
jgi:hypothetical protein